jgi:hypothetical protein
MPSEGLKYPAVKTHLPCWKDVWARMSRTYPKPVVSVDKDSCGVERGMSWDNGYTIVDAVDGETGLAGLRSGESSFVACALYSFGDLYGSGQPYEYMSSC